ncbi:hypothetical protein E3U23_11090 [Erythrobacter litoralis]|uniref:hypothetical protein n=1 Tax=Erythrobacter litoralis TaxID=39960 RepID=UPI0024354644|nr:hypothetical protein [Erythrobacter litoralis]MDG6079733.1 hypothetical protein [Erythrobacter litoralis]
MNATATPFGSLAAKIAGNTLSRKARALLERGDNPRSGQPVWRNSYTEGTFEDRIWRPINDGSTRGGKRWTSALLKAARAFEIKTRTKRREVEPGARNGELGEVGLEVLRYLYELVDYATGRLEPAIATIASEIGRSYSAVHDALRRLRRAGFLQWIRRSRPIDKPDPYGPQVEQVSNAYALLAPEAMKGWLMRLIGKAPLPACENQRRANDRLEFERMLRQLTAREYVEQQRWNGDDLLGEQLKRLAALVDAQERHQRESGRSGETGVVVPTT